MAARLPGRNTGKVVRVTTLRHENCGGLLAKLQTPGRYRCQLCGGLLKLGRAGSYGGAEGYIKSQIRKGKL